MERLIPDEGKQSGFISIPCLEQLAEPPGQELPRMRFQGREKLPSQGLGRVSQAGGAEISPALQLNTRREQTNLAPSASQELPTHPGPNQENAELSELLLGWIPKKMLNSQNSHTASPCNTEWLSGLHAGTSPPWSRTCSQAMGMPRKSHKSTSGRGISRAKPYPIAAKGI